MNDWKSSVLSAKSTIKEAIRVLDEAGLRVVLVVDAKGCLQGTVTDGDIRRALIRHVNLDCPVQQVMNPRPLTKTSDMSREETYQLMKAKDVLQIPVIDNNRTVVGLELFSEILTPKALNNRVLIMAGGYGKRLRPLTNNIPKPMLKIGGTPIIELLVEQLVRVGLTELFISVFYRAETVRDHFDDGGRFGANIKYLEEEEPLGTAGALSSMPIENIDAPTLIVNGDIVTQIDFKELLSFHDGEPGSLTVCAREYQTQIPYGVINLVNSAVIGILEKPIEKKLINAGIYVVDPAVVSEVSIGAPLSMTDLINLNIKKGRKVNVFPIHEYWMDIGMMDQYEKAIQDREMIGSDR